MKEIERIFTELVESIEVNGYYREVRKISVQNNHRNQPWTKVIVFSSSIYILFTDFKNDDESAPEINLGNKIHNKWYFRLYNKIIEEYTNSDEDYLSMNDNYSEIRFYTDWISKLEYSVTGLYLRVNLAELISFIRDKKISKLLE
jgi:hypothetical protein